MISAGGNRWWGDSAALGRPLARGRQRQTARHLFGERHLDVRNVPIITWPTSPAAYVATALTAGALVRTVGR